MRTGMGVLGGLRLTSNALRTADSFNAVYAERVKSVGGKRDYTARFNRVNGLAKIDLFQRLLNPRIGSFSVHQSISYTAHRRPPMGALVIGRQGLESKGVAPQ